MYNMKAYRNETYNNIYLRQTRCKPVDKTYPSINIQTCQE